MDYYESPQIGGYRIEMPFPQLFYPEINSVSQLFSQSAYSNTDPQHRVSNSPFQRDFYDSGCGRDAYMSSHSSRRNASSPSLRDLPFHMDFYDSGCKENPDILEESCNMGYRPRLRSHQPFGYGRNDRQSRRAREMRLRNGLYTPYDGHDKHSTYPPYGGDAMEPSMSITSMWH